MPAELVKKYRIDQHKIECKMPVSAKRDDVEKRNDFPNTGETIGYKI